MRSKKRILKEFLGDQREESQTYLVYGRINCSAASALVFYNIALKSFLKRTRGFRDFYLLPKRKKYSKKVISVICQRTINLYMFRDAFLVKKKLEIFDEQSGILIFFPRKRIRKRLKDTKLCTNTSSLPYVWVMDQVCWVTMAGYWPSSFFACLWTETKSRFINSQKKNLANIQPSWPSKLGQKRIYYMAFGAIFLAGYSG